MTERIGQDKIFQIEEGLRDKIVKKIMKLEEMRTD